VIRTLRLVILLTVLSLLAAILPSALAESSVYPNDPLFAQQWYLHNTGQEGGKPGADIRAPEAWSITRCSPKIIIADIDTGVDANHPDLASQLVPGMAFGTGNSSTADEQGHGTLTVGIIAAAADNGIGISGVCPLGRVMPLRIHDIANGAFDHVNSYRVARAIRWAVNHGARVINMSIGVDYTPELEAAAQYAYNRGVVQVAAAGNSGGKTTLYPADLPHVLAVGGTDNRDTRWAGSSYGLNQAFVLAPAKNILSTTADGSYREFTGTSLATPQVSGLAALLLSARPDLTVDQVIAAIEQGADFVQGQTGDDEKDGFGRIDCYRSLQIAEGMSSATPVETPGPTDTPERLFAATASVAIKTLKPGQKQTLRVTARAGSHIATQIDYSNLGISSHSGTADASGHYRYSWRVPRIRGKVDVTVDVSTEDGERAIAHTHFLIR
jgi:subtilisin family serine protease